MKFVLLICMFFSSLFFANEDSDRTVSELTVSELKEIVRMIVEESIEQCTVTGTMEGRAKLNLAVEGEVIAKMTCEFK